MKNTLTNSEINSLIAACMLSANRYNQMWIENQRGIDLLESKKYRDLENKLRDLCYEKNKKLIAVS